MLKEARERFGKAISIAKAVKSAAWDGPQDEESSGQPPITSEAQRGRTDLHIHGLKGAELVGGSGSSVPENLAYLELGKKIVTDPATVQMVRAGWLDQDDINRMQAEAWSKATGQPNPLTERRKAAEVLYSQVHGFVVNNIGLRPRRKSIIQRARMRRRLRSALNAHQKG